LKKHLAHFELLQNDEEVKSLATVVEELSSVHEVFCPNQTEGPKTLSLKTQLSLMK